MMWIILGVFLISFFGDYIRQNFFGTAKEEASQPSPHQRYSEDAPQVNVDANTLTTLGQMSKDQAEQFAFEVPDKMTVNVLFCTG